MTDLLTTSNQEMLAHLKIALGGVTKSLQAAILTLEQNPPERKFLTYIKIFSQEDFALKSKL